MIHQRLPRNGCSSPAHPCPRPPYRPQLSAAVVWAKSAPRRLNAIALLRCGERQSPDVVQISTFRASTRSCHIRTIKPCLDMRADSRGEADASWLTEFGGRCETLALDP